MRNRKTHQQVVLSIEAKRKKLIEKMKKLADEERVAAAKDAAETKKREAVRMRCFGAALNLVAKKRVVPLDALRMLFEKLPECKERDLALEQLATLGEDLAA